jgi:hypothetical protein
MSANFATSNYAASDVLPFVLMVASSGAFNTL